MAAVGQIIRQEGYAPVNGCKFYWRVVGPLGAPVLVFCHSLFLSAEQFDPQIQEFSERFLCLSWDQRGHGRTVAEGKFDFWDSARDLLDILDFLGLQTVESLFGASQGGFVAMRACLLAPTRFRSLVIMGSSADEEDPLIRQQFSELRDVWTSEGMDGVVQKISFMAFGDALPAEQLLIMEQKIQQTPQPRGGLDIVESVISRDSVTDQLSKIDHIPTLIFHGERDAAYPVEKGQEILDGVGNKTGKNKMVVIPGAPHFLNITNADAIRDPIDKFLSDVGLTKEEAGITDDYDPDAFNMQLKNAPSSVSPLVQPRAQFPSPSPY